MATERPLPKNAHLIPSRAKRVFKGEIFEVYQWPQKLFDGSTATFEMLKRPDTVDALCLLEDKVVLLRQQQPDSKEYWSLPGGRVDPGEDIYSCVQRETLEETGIEFKDWKLVHAEQIAHKVEGFLYTFVATNPVRRIAQKLDAGERIEVKEVPYERVIEMVKQEVPEIGYLNYLKAKLINGQTELTDIVSDKGIS